jgi:HEPN domain-containing protein
MPGHEMALELLQMAKSDLKAIEHMLDPEAFDDGVFGFHAQQAVEKSLKAWLNILGRPHPFAHDLSLLLHELRRQGAGVEQYWRFLDLSGYAVRFRYETLPDGEEPLDREDLVQNVRGLINHVERLI